MNRADFIEILERFKESLREKSYEQIVRFRRFIGEFLIRDEDAKMVVAITQMDFEQAMQMIQAIMEIEDLKKPSCKEEFDKIMRGFRK